MDTRNEDVISKKKVSKFRGRIAKTIAVPRDQTRSGTRGKWTRPGIGMDATDGEEDEDECASEFSEVDDD